MQRKPIFSFNDTTEVGLDEVPNNSIILIENAGSNIPKQIVLLNTSNITALTTVNDLLTTLTADWKELNAATLDGIDSTAFSQLGVASTFTAPQRTSITAEDNIIDFTTGQNFTLTATAANMGTPVVTGCTGQAGTIVIYSAENITGWDALYKFKNVPTGLTGEETFGYFIESETSIRIGKIV